MVLISLSVLMVIYTQLILYFVLQDKVPIPRSRTFTSWNSWPGYQDFDEINFISAPVSTKPSISMMFICIFSFGLWPFIKAFQNSCFMLSPEKKNVLLIETVFSFRAVWLLTTGIKPFNFSVDELYQYWLGMIEPNLILENVRGPLRFLWEMVTFPVLC